MRASSLLQPAPFRPRLVACLRGYRRADFAGDAAAGLTVGLIALPLAMALGIASIRPGVATEFPAPAIGIFTAIIAGFLISALGGSRVQIGGPTAAFIPVVLGIVAAHGYGGLLVATVMAGVILILMGIMRMGALIKYIPYPVTSGFTTGIAVSIMSSQAAEFLGLATDASTPGALLPKVGWIVRHGSEVNWASAVLAAACVAAIIFWKHLGLKRLPGAVVVVVVATVLVAVTGLPVETIGSKFPGGVPSALPPFEMPPFDWATLGQLVVPATTIAILGAIESLLSAVVADGLANDRHDSNTELVAQGIANVVTPFFGGLPATGAIARTTANVGAGARTPVAGILHAGVLVLVVVAAAPLARHVPMPAMAAVLVAVALRMGEWHEVVRLGRMPGSDALVLVTTMMLTILFDLSVAVQVGVVLAALLFVKRISETTEVALVGRDDELVTAEHQVRGRDIPPGVVVYRIFGPFFFGAAEKMESALSRGTGLPQVLILQMQLVPAMDATALNALESLVERMQAAGRTVVLSGPHRQPFEMMRRAGFVERIGRVNLRGNLDEALERARELVGNPRPPATP